MTYSTRSLKKACKKYIYDNYGYPANRFINDFINKELKPQYGNNRVHVFSQNDRYIPPLPTHYEGGVCYFLKSQMSTGKTRQIKTYLKKLTIAHGKKGERPTILLISPRRTFAKAQFYAYGTEFGFVCYDQIAKKTRFSKFTTPRLICQLQSLYRMDASWTYNVRYDVLILDEASSVFQEFASDVTRRRQEVYNVLKLVVQGAGRIICVDSNLGEREVNAIRDLLDCTDKKNLPMHFVFQINHSAGMFERGLDIQFYENCFLNVKPCFYRELKGLMGVIERERNLRSGLLSPIVCKINQFICAITGETDNYDLYTAWYLSAYRHILHNSIFSSEFIASMSLQNDITCSLYKDLCDGYNLAVISTTKVILQRLEKITAGRFKSVFITGDTSNEIKNAFCREDRFASLFRDVRLFGFTCAYKVGIDINLDHFDRVYLFLDLSYSKVPNVGDILQCIGRIRRNHSKTIKVHFLAGISDRVIELTGLPDENNSNTVNNHLSKTLERFTSTFNIIDLEKKPNTDPPGLKKIVKAFTAEHQLTEYPAMYLACFVRIMREVCLKKYKTFITHESCRGESLIRTLIQLDMRIGERNKYFVRSLFEKMNIWMKQKIEHSYATVLEKCVRLTDIDASRTIDTKRTECASELLQFASMMNERSYILRTYLSVCIDKKSVATQTLNRVPNTGLTLIAHNWISPIDSINKHPIGKLTELHTNVKYVHKLIASFVVKAFNAYQIDHHHYQSCIDIKDLDILGQLYQSIRSILLRNKFDGDEYGIYVTSLNVPGEFYRYHSDLIDSVYSTFYKREIVRHRESNLIQVLKHVYGVGTRVFRLKLKDIVAKKKFGTVYKFDERRMNSFITEIPNIVSSVKIMSTLKGFEMSNTLDCEKEDEGYFEFD